MAIAKAEIARLQTLTKGPKAPPQVEAAELRAALGRMDSKTRDQALANAVKFGDDNLLGAVLQAASPILTGLTPTEFSTLRTQWALKNCRREVDRIDRLQRAVDRLMTAGTAAVNFLVGLNPQAELEAAERADAEARKAAEAAA